MTGSNKSITKKTDFHHLIQNQNLRTLFQPIVAFNGNEVETHGFEALTRGPKTSPYSSAKSLFDEAAKQNKLYTLDQISRKLAIERFNETDHSKLFLNLDPNIIYDDSFAPDNTLKYLRQRNISKDQVIFEITEHNRVEQHNAFEKAVNHYRKQGYRLAVDDVGCGYANLDKISRLEPDYMKIDMSIIRDLHTNRSHYKLVETIIDFGHRIGSEVIGEGIESREELQTLLSLGIDYGQGYFIARPGPTPNGVNEQVIDVHKDLLKTEDHQQIPTIDQISTKVKTFSPDTITQQVYRYLEDNPNEQSVVIVNNKKPLGYLTRQQLHKQLSTNIKQSLYWKRPIDKIMDEDPLILPSDTSVTHASKLVTNTKDLDFYNEILVIDPNSGCYRGNVSIKQLLERITKFKTQKARQANPLTGLPGNVEIRNYMKQQLSLECEFALIYVDLDHFKPFNDYYGFEHGDEAILLLKEILSHALKIFPSKLNFLGHVGGDDFVAITTPNHVEELCEYVIDQFDERILSLYDSDDIQRGFIQTMNRDEEEKRFNIMTVSLAVVTNVERDFENHLEMSETAAEMKKYVKRNRTESSYEIDRRTEKMTALDSSEV